MDSRFFYRLRVYLIGFILGIFVVKVLFKGRGGCKMPGTLKIEELRSQYLEYSNHATCRMKCRHISEKEIKEVLNSGSVNYSKSNVQDKPCGTYAVEGEVNNKNLRIVVADCDTISKIITVIDLSLEKDSCDCK